jgi:hypothetical protein
VPVLYLTVRDGVGSPVMELPLVYAATVPLPESTHLRQVGVVGGLSATVRDSAHLLCLHTYALTALLYSTIHLRACPVCLYTLVGRQMLFGVCQSTTVLPAT